MQLDARNSRPALELDPLQRAIVLVERGSVSLVAGNKLICLRSACSTLSMRRWTARASEPILSTRWSAKVVERGHGLSSLSTRNLDDAAAEPSVVNAQSEGPESSVR
ncbi:MAG: hypothetical protein ABGX04_16095, partial [Myxococcales bacterium]